MKTQHTPGPWFVSMDGRTITSGGNGTNIAIPCVLQHGMKGDKDANARLIASAPQLLETLEALVEAYSDTIIPECQFIANARAAIAKAKGETL